MRRPIASAVLTSVVAVAWVAAPTVSAAEPPMRDRGVQIVLAVTASASPGDLVEVGGTCDNSEWVRVRLYAVGSGGAAAGRDTSVDGDLHSDGHFQVEMLVPNHWGAGAYVASAMCGAGDVAYPPNRAPMTIVGEPTGALTLNVAPGAVRPGESTTVTGECPFAVDDGSVTLDVRPLEGDEERLAVDGSTAADGTFAVALPIPADHTPGTYQVGIICRVGGQSTGDINEASRYLTVLGEPAPVPPPPPAAPATPVTATPTVTG